jgi:hypothetical protein
MSKYVALVLFIIIVTISTVIGFMGGTYYTLSTVEKQQTLNKELYKFKNLW